MLKMFNYTRSSNENQNAIVDSALELARAYYDGKKPADYDEKNKLVLESMAKFAVEGTKFETMYENEGLKIFNHSQVKNSTNVRENFDVVLAQIVSAIVPEVVNDTFARFIAEVHQVGYGETARFQIESNDLFRVNSKAEGVRKGVDQPLFDNEITVNATNHTIDTHIDWYPLASGTFNIGSWGVRIARSFMAHIFIKAIKGMTAATTEFGSAYTINGITPELFGDLKAKVSAANGGMNVIVIGTPVALSNLSLQGNYQVQVGEEMTKVGYLDQYLGTPIVAIDNVLVPGTTNTSAKLALDNKVMYMIPAAGDKPVKIVFEGNEVSVNFVPENCSDSRLGLSVEMRYGVSTICGSKYGTIKLA